MGACRPPPAAPRTPLPRPMLPTPLTLPIPTPPRPAMPPTPPASLPIPPTPTPPTPTPTPRPLTPPTPPIPPIPTPLPTPPPPLTPLTPPIAPLVAAESFGEDRLLLSAWAMLASNPSAAAASLSSWVSCFGLVTSVPACVLPLAAPPWLADAFRGAALGEESVCSRACYFAPMYAAKLKASVQMVLAFRTFAPCALPRRLYHVVWI